MRRIEGRVLVHRPKPRGGPARRRSSGIAERGRRRCRTVGCVTDLDGAVVRWWGGLPFRARAAVATLTVMVVVAGAVAVAVRDDGRATTTVAAGGVDDAGADRFDGATSTTQTDQPEATSIPPLAPVTTATSQPVTSSTAATTTPPDPAPPGRRNLVAARDGGWVLRAVDDGLGCVELEAAGQSYGRLLCGAAPATTVVGDLVTIDVGGSHFLVAVVAEGVTGFSGYPRAAGQISNDAGATGSDPKRPGLHYLAGMTAIRSHPVVDVLVRGEQDSLARLVVPAEVGAFPAGSFELHTTAPYGRWPGYRYGGMSGLFGGGVQEIGFYDGPGGVTCVLYRRLGRVDRMFLDACPSRVDGRAIAHAVLSPENPGSGSGYSQPVVVLDGPVTGWRCELSGGSPCSISPYLVKDPRNSGRALGVPNTSVQSPGSHREVVFIALQGQAEAGRMTVAVDGGEAAPPSGAGGQP